MKKKKNLNNKKNNNAKKITVGNKNINKILIFFLICVVLVNIILLVYVINMFNIYMNVPTREEYDELNASLLYEHQKTISLNKEILFIKDVLYLTSGSGLLLVICMFFKG